MQKVKSAIRNFNFVAIIGICLFLNSCNSEKKKTDSKNEKQEYQLIGNTQGTTFTIKIVDARNNVVPEEITFALSQFDSALNSYIPNSIISKINSQAIGTIGYKDQFGYFKQCFQKSRVVFQETEGAFEPGIFPLVKAWGFFKNENTVLSESQVKAILPLIDFTEGKYFSIRFSNDSVYFTKRNKDFKLDFNAIAQGYAVDVLSQIIESKDHFSYYVEIGGELRVSGQNKNNLNWVIGIDKAEDNKDAVTDRPIQALLSLTTGGLATSGNYRKFYIKDGKKYAHIIDPNSGFPVQHSLLSATVFAETTADADAYATAFMVMGVEKTQEFLLKHPKLNLESYLIYNEDNKVKTWSSKGFEKLLKN